jgi:hypothetical protein
MNSAPTHRPMAMTTTTLLLGLILMTMAGDGEDGEVTTTAKTTMATDTADKASEATNGIQHLDHGLETTQIIIWIEDKHLQCA